MLPVCNHIGSLNDGPQKNALRELRTACQALNCGIVFDDVRLEMGRTRRTTIRSTQLLRLAQRANLVTCYVDQCRECLTFSRDRDAPYLF